MGRKCVVKQKRESDSKCEENVSSEVVNLAVNAQSWLQAAASQTLKYSSCLLLATTNMLSKNHTLLWCYVVMVQV